MLDIISRQELIRLREGQQYHNLIVVNNGKPIYIYNTGRGDGTNYERLEILCDSNLFKIRAVKGGSGTRRNITIDPLTLLTVTGALLAEGAYIATAGYLQSGPSPADSGQVRLPNAASIKTRNQGGDGNISLIESNSDNEVVVASGGATTRVKGVVIVGAGTGQATTGDIRMASARKIVSRNNAGGADIDLLQALSTDIVQVGGAVVTVGTQLNLASKEFVAPVGASW
jgi:hypothetical protein